MKRNTIIVLALVLALASVSALAYGVQGNVVNTKHNMRSGSASVTRATDAAAQTQVCVFCHTPHNAQPAPTYGASQLIPLWNHANTVAVFQPYSSATMDANPVPGQPSGVSKACLSCHDGTVAVGSLIWTYAGGAPTSVDMQGNVTAADLMTGNAAMGIDLRNDHPISFSMQSSITAGDTSLNPINTVIAATGIANGLQIDTGLLVGGSVECSSCHAVHGTPGFAGAEYQPLLKLTKTNSALCTTCHIK